jgi:hypothetical protein
MHLHARTHYMLACTSHLDVVGVLYKSYKARSHYQRAHRCLSVAMYMRCVLLTSSLLLLGPRLLNACPACLLVQLLRYVWSNQVQVQLMIRQQHGQLCKGWKQ